MHKSSTLYNNNKKAVRYDGTFKAI